MFRFLPRHVFCALNRKVHTTTPRRNSGLIWKPIAFTVATGATTFGLSWVYLENQRRTYRDRRSTRRRVYTEEGTIKKWWNNLSTADKFSVTIIAVNAGVFLMWRIRPLYPLMEKYFLTTPANKNTVSLLLSGFSHIDGWHLALNMMVLWSFAPALFECLGDTTTAAYAVPFYLTGGTFASMVGHYFKLARGNMAGSLGASGALMAVVTLVVMNNPDSSLYFIFVPFIPIPAKWALTGVVSLDVIGVIRNWQFFDHAGHLGGVAFGL